jgi:hypothetical protein
MSKENVQNLNFYLLIKLNSYGICLKLKKKSMKKISKIYLSYVSVYIFL